MTDKCELTEGELVSARNALSTGKIPDWLRWDFFIKVINQALNLEKRVEELKKSLSQECKKTLYKMEELAKSDGLHLMESMDRMELIKDLQSHLKKSKAQVKELEDDLAVNASLLAKQTDMAREAELNAAGMRDFIEGLRSLFDTLSWSDRLDKALSPPAPEKEKLTAHCYDCGLEYAGEAWIEAVIPLDVWRIISPYKTEAGLLCISCIAKRLRKQGIKDVPVWLVGTEPLIAMGGESADPEPHFSNVCLKCEIYPTLKDGQSCSCTPKPDRDELMEAAKEVVGRIPSKAHLHRIMRGNDRMSQGHYKEWINALDNLAALVDE